MTTLDELLQNNREWAEQVRREGQHRNLAHPAARQHFREIARHRGCCGAEAKPEEDS